MSDIKLFSLSESGVTEIEGHSVALEKSLQQLIERHLEAILGVRFLASEYSTGAKHGGRIDTLGIDENGYPVIIEYKRARNENVINQGLYYLDWLMDHRGTFEMLVQKQLGRAVAEGVEWSGPRLLCIAGDFTKYDQYAVGQINRNIELLRYRRYGDDLLLLEQINAGRSDSSTTPNNGGSGSTPDRRTVSYALSQASPQLTDRFNALKTYIEALGDDVVMKTLKNYFAFKRIKNFACVEVHTQSGQLLVHLKIDPDTVQLEEGFSRDMRGIGHYGTGDLELRLRNDEDLRKAELLIAKSYEGS